jgi:hypothetical protein
MMQRGPEDSLISFVTAEFGICLMQNHIHQFGTLLIEYTILFQL